MPTSSMKRVIKKKELDILKDQISDHIKNQNDFWEYLIKLKVKNEPLNIDQIMTDYELYNLAPLE